MEFITALHPQPQLMNTLSTRLPTTLLRFPLPSTTTTTTTAFNVFAASSTSYSTTTTTTIPTVEPIIIPDPITPLPQKTKTTTRRAKVSKVISQGLLKENWLNSLSSPFPTCSEIETDEGSNWVIGIDPDTSGALALLKPEGSVEVYDSPHLKVPVGNKERKRLDPKSIVQLIQSFDAPSGTTAYVEQSLPFPKDGKQGWWSGGFGYGLWIGILVASGITVVPVPSFVWKNELKLSGSCSKDDSRELASTLFPSISSMLKRKKDHGRAEALLIAAYGKGMRMPSESSCMVENIVP